MPRTRALTSPVVWSFPWLVVAFGLLGLAYASFVRSRRPALYAALDGRLAAILAVADPVKPTTPAALAALHALGLRVVMITGDNARTARAVAQGLNIDETVAEVLPTDKAEAPGRSSFTGPCSIS